MSDEQLAQLAAGGSEAAFAAIYDRYLPALVRFCGGILMSREDAEDAAQTAMMHALRALGERPPAIRLRPWLYRIAHNEAISLVRGRRHHEDLEGAVGVSLPGPEEVLAIRMRLAQLVSDLRELPERQRGALVMRELCGLEYEEIADALGTSSGAAMQTVFEARSALSEYADAREESCVSIQRCISDGDRRRLRARRVRAHLRGCQQCRSFQLSLGTRREELALLLPVAGKGALVALLGALGGGGGRVLLGGSGRVLLGGGTSQGLKVAAVGAVLASAGGGLAVQMARPPAHTPGTAGVARLPALKTAHPHHGARLRTAAAVAGMLSGVEHHVRHSSTSTSVDPTSRHQSLASVPGVTADPSPVPAAPPAPAPAPGAAPSPTSAVPAPVQHAPAPAPPASTPMQQWIQWMASHGGGSPSGARAPGAAAADATPPNAYVQYVQQAQHLADPTALVQQVTQRVGQLVQGSMSGCVEQQVGPVRIKVGPGCTP